MVVHRRVRSAFNFRHLIPCVRTVHHASDHINAKRSQHGNILVFCGTVDLMTISAHAYPFQTRSLACKTHSSLTPLLVGNTASGDALNDLLPVLVELELGDLDLAWGNTERHSLAVGLLALDTLDVDHVLEAVHGSDLALTTLVGSTLDGDLVALGDRDGADVVLLAELYDSTPVSNAPEPEICY